VTRLVCVTVHDVAPATWPQCELLLDLLDALGCRAITLLAVPHFHHGLRLAAAPEVVRKLERWIAAGAEVALHGYYHLDESPPPREPREWLRRRWLTDGEGEFEALSEYEAAARIARGLAELHALGWPVQGFVPPAWLAGAGTLRALERSPLRYTTSHAAITLLRDGARIAAPCFTASTRAAWRRRASLALLAGMRATTRHAAVLRVALHPADMAHGEIMAYWRKLLRELLEEREAVTKSTALAVVAGEAKRALSEA